MEQSPSCATNSFPEGQEILLHFILWSQKVHYRVHKTATCPYPVPVQSSPRPLSYPLKSTFILSSHLCLGLPSGFLSLGFPTKTPYTFLFSPTSASYVHIAVNNRAFLECDAVQFITCLPTASVFSAR